MSKIVVFGGDGFIGRHLVKRLALSNKADEIYVFDRFSSYQNNSNHPFDKIPNVQIVRGNFFNRDEVSDVLKNAKYVFHLISSTNPATSQNDPLIDIDTNIRSSVELFQLCVENDVKKVIFFSSGGTIYGDIDSEMIGEDSVPQPLSPYGIGKLTIEHYLRYFKHTHGLDYIVYRIANPYGPGQNIYGKQGVIPIFMHRYITHEPLVIYGDGTMMRDYIYIDDLISMIVGSYDKQSKNEVYNIGSGNGTSINELIVAIESCSQYSVEKKHAEVPSTYIQNSVLNIDRFTKDFNLCPMISLEEGIKRTWDYVKDL
jgi:UDP-glucose 4-epimerase